MNPARVAPVVLWAIAALLFAATLWPFVAPLGVDRDAIVAANRPAKPFAAPSVGDLALPPQDTLTATLSRPLFNATRRPPSPLATLQGGAPPPEASQPVATGPKGARLILGAYYLRGVVVTPARKMVLFQHHSTGKSLRLGEGEKLDNWTVAAIGPDAVVLRQGDRQESIPLHERK